VVLNDLFSSDYVPADPDELFDGDTIDLGDHVLKVIWTPGHTDGSMCLYDEMTKSLFSGDTVFSEGVGRTDFPTGSIVELRSSVERISSIDIIGIYPGHGDPRCEDGRRSIDTAMRIVGV
jgi:glyoxylase-like metal-dependent hydrolase (beta-lactamase superfamily II)